MTIEIILIVLIITAAYTFFVLWRKEKEYADYYFEMYKQEKDEKNRYYTKAKNECKYRMHTQQKVMSADNLDTLKKEIFVIEIEDEKIQ